MKTKAGVPFAVFCILVVFLAIGLKGDPTKIPSPLIGKPAPEFTLPSLLSTGTVSLQSRKGKVWLLNVWASWCAACVDEHPLLNSLAQQDLVEIVGLNYKDAASDAADWLARLGNPYNEIAVDRNGDTAIEYGVYGVPETFLVDEQGVIRFKHIGPITPSILEREILPRVHDLQNPGN